MKCSMNAAVNNLSINNRVLKRGGGGETTTTELSLSLSLHSFARFDFVIHRFVYFSFPFRLKSKNRTLNAISRLLYTAISAGRCVNEAAFFCNSRVRLRFIAYVR